MTFKPEGSKERTPNARVSLLVDPGGKLVEKDLAHQERVLAMFEEFRQRTPHLTRVGITGRQIEDLIRRQREKLEDLREYLKNHEDER